MNIRKIFLLVFAFCFCACGAFALTAEDIASALIFSAEQTRRQQYQQFQPSLPSEDAAKIPSLLQGAAQRLQKAGYSHITTNNIVEGLWLYFLVEYHLVGEEAETDNIQRKHALAYSFNKLFPSVLPYKQASYPPVENWVEFHKLCQRDMNIIYSLLQYLQTCDWDNFNLVLCNVM